jgi:asparagine synthase (glutamine-hydrolysing)
MYIKNIDIYDITKNLEGEFAFVLIDIQKDNLIIHYSRDRFGIRPLFYHKNENGYYFSSELKGLPFNGLGTQVEPRKIYSIQKEYIKYSYYYKIGTLYNDLSINELELWNLKRTEENILKSIRKSLVESVLNRIESERPIGALLSGGLDSSLVCGIAAKYLSTFGKRLHTFSIGIEEDAPDIQHARLVANYINSVHHEVIIPVEKWLESLEDVVKHIETYDITTIRATCGQYLISKWISENTDIKVLLVGDGSDELCSGYKYFYFSPNEEEAHLENINLLENIHKYDVLRCDRGISAWGLEARVPFLCHKFVDCYLSIDKSLRVPIKHKRIEKYLLRKAFKDEDIIPDKVLNRNKDAFSDGISNVKKSWYEYIQEYMDTLITEDEFEDVKEKFLSKESYWYYKIYKKYYPESTLKVEMWMPKWTTNHNGDPSARKLVI